MMYPYLTLNDDTEITHSEVRPDGRVKVYIETPDEKDGFHDATCYLPDYTWESIHGYSDQEMEYFNRLIRDNAHLILEFAQKGGVLNASNFLGLAPIYVLLLVKRRNTLRARSRSYCRRKSLRKCYQSLDHTLRPHSSL